MSQDLIIGLDIGATKIVSGCLNLKGEIIGQSARNPTLAQSDEQTVLNQVFKSLDELNCDWQKVKGIGVCAPGPLKQGVLINPPNIPSWRNIPLAKIIEDKYKVPVSLDNDANAAAYAEMIFGAGKGYKNFVYVTVSTGIGTGIIIDGKIYRGKNGLAGEGGHITINFEKEIDCNCGVPGCIESIASGTAIAKRAKKLMANSSKDKLQTSLWDYFPDGNLENLTTSDLGKAIKLSQDKFAISLIEEAGHMISIWLGGIISLLDPQAIIIGGGVASNTEGILIDKIKNTMSNYTINKFANEIPILPAGLTHNVSIYGAAALIHHDHGDN
jgi:glucokinase